MGKASVRQFSWCRNLDPHARAGAVRWRHEVLFEGFPPSNPKVKYALCLEGERACPPEDCGGPWGYADYLAAIADPKHEQHEEMLEWRGPFDPEAFDAKKATKEMRKVNP